MAKTLPSSQSNQLSELGSRESMLTPSQREQAREHANRNRSQSTASTMTTASSSTMTGTPETKSLAEVESRYREESEMVRQAQAAVNERPNFAIDAIGDSDDEGSEGEGEDAMDEVSKVDDGFVGDFG